MPGIGRPWGVAGPPRPHRQRGASPQVTSAQTLECKPGLHRVCGGSRAVDRCSSRLMIGERVRRGQFEAVLGADVVWHVWLGGAGLTPNARRIRLSAGLKLFVTVFLLFCVLPAILVCEQDFFSPRVRDVGPRCSHGSRGLLRSRARRCRCRQPCRTSRSAYQ